MILFFFFFFQAEDGIRDVAVTGVQTCALPISARARPAEASRPAAVRVALVLPPPVRVQRAGARPRRRRGEAGRRAGRTPYRRGMGWRGARARRTQARGAHHRPHPRRVRSGVRTRATHHRRAGGGRRAAVIRPVSAVPGCVLQRYVTSGRGGEIGRRKGLKIPWGATPVQVRVLPSAWSYGGVRSLKYAATSKLVGSTSK